MDTKFFTLSELNIDETIIKEAANFIKNGKTVVFPTETVYGLGANAFESSAISKIFLAKGRPSDNPLIVHVSDIDMLLYTIGESLSFSAKTLIDRFWPGPLTLVFKKSDKIPKCVTAGLDTVACRMPSNKIALALIKESKVPIAAPSANLSGKPSPTSCEHVIADMSGRVDMILCAEDAAVGVESTVLDITGDIPTILRPGGITYESLLDVLGEVSIDKGLSGEGVPKSPGMKYTHYAPKAPLLIVKGDKDKVYNAIGAFIKSEIKKGKKVGVLTFDDNKSLYKDCTVLSIGDRNNKSEAAHNIFSTLRKFDKIGVDIIYAEAIDEVEMGFAVMNRMKKAAGFNIVEV